MNPSALLTLDCQKGIVDRVPGASAIFERAGRVVEASRKAGVPVLHVGLSFRPGYPEIHPGHPTFSLLKQRGDFLEGSESACFHDSVFRRGDITVAKHRVSAFSGNDLKMILRAQGATTLVLFGIATSGIVLSTVRQACDMDFRCIVIKDCCFDADEEVHRVLTEKVFARQATVLTTEEFIQNLVFPV